MLNSTACKLLYQQVYFNILYMYTQCMYSMHATLVLL